jgi:hypothetical protein
MKQRFGLRKTDMELPNFKSQKMYMAMFYDMHNVFSIDGDVITLDVAEKELLRYMAMLLQRPIYRIMIMDDTTVETDCYDLLENFAPELKKSYDGVDSLPQWVQDKLAVLLLLDHTKSNKEVENIGRRINKSVFWVFKGEDDGDNP